MKGLMQLRHRIEEVIISQAAVQRCNASVQFNSDDRPFYQATINNKELHKHFLKVAKQMVGSENVLETQPTMGAEDFSFFAEAIPGYFYWLCMVNEAEGQLKSLHSPFSGLTKLHLRLDYYLYFHLRL